MRVKALPLLYVYHWLEKPVSKRKEKVTCKPQKQIKAKILVIDDEKDVRELLGDILTDSGHETAIADSGSEGLKMFQQGDFDLVFTDLGMPGMSGWQVAEAIKEINGKTPVALITGWEVQQKGSELKKSGVDLFINKPFRTNQVLSLVQEGMILRKRYKAA